uniref:Coiled-coil domain containing 25 n=1 Tax=Salmo trutta TaxID=8032 RepID=A0A674EDK5_SALTR
MSLIILVWRCYCCYSNCIISTGFMWINSSAHVYLRMPKGLTIEDIPKEVLIVCEMNNINIVYTPWGNLKKTGDMDVGQIGFHRHEVKIVAVEKMNEVVNRLEKKKDERYPDLAAEKESLSYVNDKLTDNMTTNEVS